MCSVPQAGKGYVNRSAVQNPPGGHAIGFGGGANTESQSGPAHQTLRRLRSAFHLAQEMVA